MRTIQVTAGAVEYVGGTVKEKFGKNISAATIVMALGASPSDAPDDWVAPTTTTAGGSPAERIVRLEVSSSTPPGSYWCWVKITDAPEILPRVFEGQIIVR